MDITLYEGIKKFQPNYENNIQSLPFEKHGIWPSEMFMFCGLVEIHNIDIIIESGTANGCATRILAYNFPNKKIYSVEFPVQGDGTGYPDFVKESKKYSNLTLLNGDSFEEIPKILETIKLSNLNVSILIDGPKDNKSLLLYYKCCQYKNVKFVCIHDVDRCWGSVNRNMKNIKGYAMLTSESQHYRKFVKSLDKDKVTPEYIQKYKNGPGLGLIYNHGYSLFHVIVIYFFIFFRVFEKIYLQKLKT